MRPIVLWIVLAVWLVASAALMWLFNPISAADLAEVCTAAQNPESRASANRR